MNTVKHIKSSTSGNTTIIVALLLPLLLAAAGAGVDLVQYSLHRSELQEAADAAALAGAKALTLATTDASSIESFVEAELDYLVNQLNFEKKFSREAKISIQEGIVKTAIKQQANPYFLKNFLNEAILVESEAIAAGSVKLCALSLDENSGGAISLDGEARIVASDCSVFSNSTASSAISLHSQSFIDADVICSSGGYIGSARNYTNEPVVDCPAYDDPLADSLMDPVAGACDENFYIAGSTDRGRIERQLLVASSDITITDSLLAPENEGLNPVTLSPGVYCGGLRVSSLAQATFEPGLYIIKDGPLVFDRDSTSIGENVTFYMTGTASEFFIEADAAVEFTATKEGNLAGILFMEDRNKPKNRAYIIRSRYARTLLGTFYLPNGELNINTQDPIADESAYTIIVANKILLQGRPSLVLKSDYAATDIPVPSGVGPIGGTTYLRK